MMSFQLQTQYLLRLSPPAVVKQVADALNLNMTPGSMHVQMKENGESAVVNKQDLLQSN